MARELVLRHYYIILELEAIWYQKFWATRSVLAEKKEQEETKENNMNNQKCQEKPWGENLISKVNFKKKWVSIWEFHWM